MVKRWSHKCTFYENKYRSLKGNLSAILFCGSIRPPIYYLIFLTHGIARIVYMHI